MSNRWEVSCIDQRFDDEGFEIGRNAKTSSGKWVYEIYKQVVKPVNPVIKAMIEQPNRSIKKHKSSRWKLFQSILEKETKLLKESKS